MKLRFTTLAVRGLFDNHAIDLMKLGGDDMIHDETRRKITLAGAVLAEGQTEADVLEFCDSVTPGEHIDYLNEAILRDLLPASAREAIAKDAAAKKSEAASE